MTNLWPGPQPSNEGDQVEPYLECPKKYALTVNAFTRKLENVRTKRDDYMLLPMLYPSYLRRCNTTLR